MKARPRRVENKVAEFLTEYLQSRFGSVSKVERIPVLGRAGPDIDILPVYRIAIDVKSRKSIPKSYKVEPGEIGRWGIDGLGHYQIGTRLEDLDMLFDIEKYPARTPKDHWKKRSLTINKWLKHMDDWCDDNKPVLPALVLHWPGRPIKSSVFVIYNGDRRTLNDRRNRFNDL